MAQNPPQDRNLSATLWSLLFAACLALAAAHLAVSAREQARLEVDVIRATFTEAPGQP